MRKFTKKTKAQLAAEKLESPVNVLLCSMAMAQLEREKCDAIQRRVLSEGRYVGRHCDGREFIVEDPKLAWLMSDHDHKHYWGRVDAEYKRAGYKIENYGECPALIAEHLQTQAEWALIEAAEEFFPGVTNDKLLCGTKDKGGLETRQEYIDLMIKLVVNAPGYAPPLKRAAA